MKVYYAHCLAIYDTPQEDRDIALLTVLGFQVVNPNSLEVHDACANIRALSKAHLIHGDPSARIMEEIFRPLVLSCDALAFRALPDGRIPAGIAKEIRYAQIGWGGEQVIPIFELPANVPSRVMSVEATQTYLHEIGQRDDDRTPLAPPAS